MDMHLALLSARGLQNAKFFDTAAMSKFRGEVLQLYSKFAQVQVVPFYRHKGDYSVSSIYYK